METTVTDKAPDAAECMPVMIELDATPSMDRMSKENDTLTIHKAPGKDGIPSEITKSAKGPLLSHLHNLLYLCWREGTVPQDLWDANIILYKTKGERSDCSKYCSVCLLSIFGKLFVHVVLKRLHALVQNVPWVTVRI